MVDERDGALFAIDPVFPNRRILFNITGTFKVDLAMPAFKIKEFHRKGFHEPRIFKKCPAAGKKCSVHDP
jgi:hypothetical protein